MKKIINILSFLLLISYSGFSQNVTKQIDKTLFIVKGGVGTSWITMPKVFLINPADTSSVQILPTTNSFSGYIGFQGAVPLGKHWLFMPEIDINYLSGQIRVDRINSSNQIEPNGFSEKLQAYTRIEVPLNFGVVSSDNFWISFGPVLYFTLSDNKGFDAAVREIEDPTRPEPVKLDSDIPIGLRFRLAAYVLVGKGMYVDVKFDSDLKRDFYYSESDDIYNMRMSLQSITIGFGYRINRADL